LRQGAQGTAGFGVLHQGNERDDRQDREHTNQDAIIGHNQPEIPVEHAINNLRDTALFLTENK